MAEPFDAFHLAGEILNGLEIRQITLEGNRRHQQVIANQPGNQFGFMLVDGIMMVHVELHLPDYAAEIGDESSKNRCFVHPAQHQFGITRRAEHIEEQLVGAGILANLVVNQLGIAPGHPHRQRMDFQFVLVGQPENFHQPDRIFLKEFFIGQGEPSAIQHKAIKLLWFSSERRQEPAHSGIVRLVEMGEEHTGQVADHFCVQEIILHEPFDRGLAGSIGKAHPPRHLWLQVKGQPIFRPAGDIVHMATHGPEKIGCLAKAFELVGGEQANIHQFGSGGHPMDIFADPVERLQIAQAALAFLHIGLDNIATVAHFHMAGIALGQFLRHETTVGSRDDIVEEPLLGFFINPGIAPDIATLEQGGADRQILPRHPHHFINGTATLADLETEIP